MQEINAYIDKLFGDGELSQQTYEYLLNEECRTSIFYLLPKIHKGTTPFVKGRPIVSAVNSPTEKISKFVDHFLNPCAQKTSSYIKDSTHFLNLTQDFKNLPTNTWLVTLDVTSLYTQIDNDRGLTAAKKALDNLRSNPNVKPSNSSIIELLKFVLTKNNFQFNGHNYLQLQGSSMGSRCAPAYANVFMGDFEDKYVYPYGDNIIFWKRFIDDIFCLFQGTEDQILAFIDFLNSWDDKIQFTANYSQKEVPFLDILVKIENNQLTTDLYVKPTDSHNYLKFDSAHPAKCKQSIPYSQFLRVRRICSKLTDYDRHIKDMSTHFIRRGYPIDLLCPAAIKARRVDRNSLINPIVSTVKNKSAERSILVTTFDPKSDPLKEIVHNNWNLLGKSVTTHKLHERNPLLAYRRPTNLKDLLVKANCKRRNPKSTDNTQMKTFLESKPETSKNNVQPLITKHFRKISGITNSASTGVLVQRTPNILTSSNSTEDLKILKAKF
ncbi:MAG: hypothetical protein GY705_10855, partial [Bacteroidetes bacterium]|nr:hypothetical protein [Bacteroidota bacterium]